LKATTEIEKEVSGVMGVWNIAKGEVTLKELER
jgi:hypothetical protein